MNGAVYVVGGDLRQITVAEYLAEKGYAVRSVGISDGDFAAESLKNAECVVLPIPVSCDGVYINAPLLKTKIPIADVLDNIPAGCFVMGARIDAVLAEKFKNRNIDFADYYDREELIIKNAVPTAEGTIEIALSEMPITMHGSRVLVAGYGRVGKVLAEKLKALGAQVTVSARKCADFAWISEFGMSAVHTEKIAETARDFDLIVNTVPKTVIDGEVLKNVRAETLIIDLASKPGGVDFDAAKRLGKNVIWALSLPGKSAPITSGKIIGEAVTNILAERGCDTWI